MKVKNVESPDDLPGLFHLVKQATGNNQENALLNYHRLFLLIEQQIKQDYDHSIFNPVFEEDKGEVTESLIQTDSTFEELVGFLRSVIKWCLPITLLEESGIDCSEIKNYIHISLACLLVPTNDIKKASELLKYLQLLQNFIEIKDFINTSGISFITCVRNFEINEQIRDAKMDIEVSDGPNIDDIIDAVKNIENVDFSGCRIEKIINKIKEKYHADWAEEEEEKIPEIQELSFHYLGREIADYIGGHSEQDNTSEHHNTFSPETDAFNLRNLSVESWEVLKEEKAIWTRGKGKSKNIELNIYTVKFEGETLVAKTHLLPPNHWDVRNYEKEAKIMGRAYSTGCNNFLKVFGAFPDTKDDRIRYTVVMEHCSSDLRKEIKKRIKENLKYTENELRRFAVEMINACALLNEMKIYHGDINPQNIFIQYVKDDNGKVTDIIYKLGDFDASFTSDSDEPEGTIIVDPYGTPDYMAYELSELYLKGSKPEKTKTRMSKADVCSLGLTILEMATLSSLSRRNPSKQNDVDKHITENVESDWVKTLLFQMLKVNHTERPDFITLNQTYSLAGTTLS